MLALWRRRQGSIEALISTSVESAFLDLPLKLELAGGRGGEGGVLTIEFSPQPPQWLPLPAPLLTGPV